MVTMPTRPTTTPPGPWSFPSSQRFTLDNGLRVIVHDLPGQYVVSAGLMLDVPLTSEPEDLEGVALLTASTLSEGTQLSPPVKLTTTSMPPSSRPNTRAPEQPPALRDPVGGGVVEADIGTERLQPGELLLARGAGDHRGAGLLGELDTAGADAAREIARQLSPALLEAREQGV